MTNDPHTITTESGELGSSARRTAETRVRAALGRLQGSERKIIPLVEAALTALHRECAIRRLELRAAEHEIEKLRATIERQSTR
ncbi:hypothetical protein [Microbacterium sp. LWH3-1.2]|uniref:hypothetical protein n=1 Tax=Microbacterium sp. LWH3-1.2 TaxID=3135256 RepID=UPI003418B35E